MTIRNLESFVGGLWDWGILKGCFGTTKISPSDIDGYVERNGYFLILESKRPGVRIPYGQRCAMEAMRQTGKFTVLFVWGEQNKPEKILLMTSQRDIEYEPADLAKLRSVVSAWFKWADKKATARYSKTSSEAV